MAFLESARHIKDRLQSWLQSKEATPANEVDANSWFPNWSELLSDPLWARSKGQKSGPCVLLATCTGGNPAAASFDSLLAVALRLRGAQVHFLLCDGALPACLMTSHKNREPGLLVAHGPSPEACSSCLESGLSLFSPLGLPIHRLSGLLTPEARAEAEALCNNLESHQLVDFHLEGLHLGEHARSAALRYFLSCTTEQEPLGEQVLRTYLKAAILTARATQRLLREVPFEVVVVQQGVYVPLGPVSDVTVGEGKRVVTWCPTYRAKTFFFEHGGTYHHKMLHEPLKNWQSLELTPPVLEALEQYLAGRRVGDKANWVRFWKDPVFNLEHIARHTGLDFSKPSVLLLPNIPYEAQLVYRSNAFPSMLDWLFQTIDYFAGRPDLQLVVRAHPGEFVRGDKPRQRVVDEIESRYPQLPANVFVIPPESELSTYALAEASNAVLIYGTSTGTELAAAGIPVIVAGESWMRGKGIVDEVDSPESYFSLLAALPYADRLSPEVVERARKFAFHLYFRRWIPVEFLQVIESFPRFRLGLENLSPLLQGNSRGMDVICQGILQGTPFIFEAESQLDPGVA